MKIILILFSLAATIVIAGFKTISNKVYPIADSGFNKSNRNKGFELNDADSVVVSTWPSQFHIVTNNVVTSSSSLNSPRAIARDKHGNIYIADGGNHRIHIIYATGKTSIYAGTGQIGYKDGDGSKAQFYQPNGVAVDTFDNVYVADWGNNCIRKITPDGRVTTLAGSITPGYADGFGVNAKFDHPNDVAVDLQGNLYVADAGNNRIRNVSAKGLVMTLSGSGVSGFADGAATSAKFYDLNGIAVDSLGNVYVVESGNNRIRKINVKGYVTTLAGNGTKSFADGDGKSAMFNNPSGVAIDSQGNVIVADLLNYKIRKISSSGIVTTLAGSGTQGYLDGWAPTAQFFNPIDVVADDQGNVYVIDAGNNKIRIIR